MYVVSSWMGTPPLIDVFSLIVWTAKGQQEIVAPRSGSTSEIIMVSSLCEINWCSVFIDVYLWVCVVSSWMGYASSHSCVLSRAVAVIALKNVNLLESALSATMLIIKEEAA